jgi:hypothetical protein
MFFMRTNEYSRSNWSTGKVCKYIVLVALVIFTNLYFKSETSNMLMYFSLVVLFASAIIRTVRQPEVAE